MEFQERIRREAQARNTARAILEVSEEATAEELKRAWRVQCKRHHPDRNPGDPEAGRRFKAVNAAYRLLAFGEWHGDLPKALKDPAESPDHDKYNLDNSWGFFLWWRERFFG